MTADIIPVILCGGGGARLWPASTRALPKPFLRLLDERSLLQATAMRLAGLPGARAPIVVVGQAHAALAGRQLGDVGMEAFVIAEPRSRDSGPALAAAAHWIAKTNPRALALAVACDHHIPDGAAFRAGVIQAVPAAEQGWIVAFGVKPSFPAVAYGYLRPGAMLGGGLAGRRVAAFVEKPDAARARLCLADGYLWNSGNLVFRVDSFLGEVARHAPAVGEPAGRAVDGGALTANRLVLGSAFAASEAVSTDVAVMERTAKAAVLEVGYAWSDLGSWDAVWAASPRDAAGNTVQARAAVVASEDCLIRGDGRARIVAIGLRRIAVVVEGDRILVCDLAAPGQALKDATARLGKD